MKRLLPHLYDFGDQPRSLFGHPYALARTALLHELSVLAIRCRPGKVLDVGCGSMPYRHLFPQATVYEGLEIDQPRNICNPNATYFYDGITIPLADSSYSAVLCSQVLEHSFEPELLLSEIYRILTPGGSLILTIPFFWPEHEQPYDSQRLTSFGLSKRLRDIGFVSIEMTKTNPGLAALMQLIIEWIESLYREKLSGRALSLVKAVLSVPYTIFNVLGYVYRALEKRNAAHVSPSIYLDLVILAKKP